MRVRFTQVASVQGQGYRRGEQATLPDHVGAVYCRLGQAEQIAEPKAPAAAAAADKQPPADRAAKRKKAVRRGGRNAETAERATRETR
jgi:hypothetical protein